jgi:Holliday junction resolvase RusA-like endonuclease
MSSGRLAPVMGERLSNGGWHLRIGLPLLSPNRTLNAHWAVKYRDGKSWQAAIENAKIVAIDVRTSAQHRELTAPAREVPMRVTITREVLRSGDFTTDRDNLFASVKRLLDALKRNHLIYDDSRAWLELDEPRQKVSEDGQVWTDIVIEPLDKESVYGR